MPRQTLLRITAGLALVLGVVLIVSNIRERLESTSASGVSANDVAAVQPAADVQSATLFSTIDEGDAATWTVSRPSVGAAPLCSAARALKSMPGEPVPMQDVQLSFSKRRVAALSPVVASSTAAAPTENLQFSLSFMAMTPPKAAALRVDGAAEALQAETALMNATQTGTITDEAAFLKRLANARAAQFALVGKSVDVPAETLRSVIKALDACLAHAQPAGGTL